MRNAGRTALLLGAAMTLAACSKSDAEAVTQAVAKVNKKEVTELQVQQVLEHQRGLKPEQLESAGQRAVTALVDQEIVFQKASEMKLDRDPAVVQAIEAAKRELISRAYLERIADGAPAITPDDVRAYYDSNPGLFKDRRVYNLQDLSVETTADQKREVEQQLKTLKSPAELEGYLKEHQYKIHSDRSTVAAENIPLQLLQRLASVKPGSGIVIPSPGGLRILLVNGTQDAPVTLEQARPAIETYLLNERKRVAIDKEMSSLRAGASVEYVGKFKGMAASGAAIKEMATSRPETPASSPALALPPASDATSATMDDATTAKGLTGLK